MGRERERRPIFFGRFRNRLVDQNEVARLEQVRQDLSTYSQVFTFFLGVWISTGSSLLAGIKKPFWIWVEFYVALALSIGAFILTRKEQAKKVRAEAAVRESGTYIQQDTPVVGYQHTGGEDPQLLQGQEPTTQPVSDQPPAQGDQHPRDQQGPEGPQAPKTSN